MSTWILVLGLVAWGALAGCASTATRRSTRAAPRYVQGGEFRILGRPDGSGDAYDATMLFERANTAVREHRFEQAIADYERLAREFPGSRLVPLAYFNRGVCLQANGRTDESVSSYRAAIARGQDPQVVHDAWFRIAAVAEAAQRPPLVLEAVDGALALPRLTIDDRVEALARRAAALLAQGDRLGAESNAQQAIVLAPSAETVSALGDDTYIAQARFVAAEVYRLNAAGIAIRVEDPEFEHAIERRVQLVTHAHVLFNDAIRVGNPHWAAACGFGLGEMYQALYSAIVYAQTPPGWDTNAIEAYRRRTGQRLRPLLEAALRAWEATLQMAHRLGISDNDWVRRTDAQLAELRALILNGRVSPSPPLQR